MMCDEKHAHTNFSTGNELSKGFDAVYIVFKFRLEFPYVHQLARIQSYASKRKTDKTKWTNERVNCLHVQSDRTIFIDWSAAQVEKRFERPSIGEKGQRIYLLFAVCPVPLPAHTHSIGYALSLRSSVRWSNVYRLWRVAAIGTSKSVRIFIRLPIRLPALQSCGIGYYLLRSSPYLPLPLSHCRTSRAIGKQSPTTTGQ